MTNQKKIVFSEVFDTSLDEFIEQEQTLMHSVESTINNIDVDRNELYKLGFIDSEIDLINNEKKRVMDNLKFYFSIYFFFSKICIPKFIIKNLRFNSVKKILFNFCNNLL